MMKTLTDLHHPELPMMKLLMMIKHLLLICQHLTQILDQTVLVSTMKKGLDLMEPVSMMKKVLDPMDLSMMKTLTDLHHPELPMMKLPVMIKHLLLICQHLTQILDQTVLVSTMKKGLDLMEPVSMMKKVLDPMDLSMTKTLTDLDHP